MEERNWRVVWCAREGGSPPSEKGTGMNKRRGEGHALAIAGVCWLCARVVRWWWWW